MTAPVKLVLGVAAGLAAFSVLVAAVRSLTGGTPGGPTSSSYATGADGLAAYAQVLVRRGHPVRRVREDAAHAELDRRSTVVLLDPRSVTRADASALRKFVARGGRLVAGGARPNDWLAGLLNAAPEWRAGGTRSARVLLPVPELAAVRNVRAAGEGSWRDTGEALPVLAGGGRNLFAVANLGRGRVLLLADASPLQNRLLDEADNAALGLALAGARNRPVAFLERYHGYGRATGLAAIPHGWRDALLLSAAAGLVFMLARGRRLGPAEAASRELPPPRRAYVEALAGAVARTRRRHAAVEPVQAHVRELIAKRSGLSRDANAASLAAAAKRLKLGEDEIAAVLGEVRRDADVVAVGRALARVAPGVRA